MRQTYKQFRVLVVDNAPSDNSTERMLRAEFQSVDYVCEPEPGLDNARNRAIYEAHSEILAFIDDDALADTNWVQALVNAFETPDVMCVTGLVAPARLDTGAQELFERFGYTKGFARLRFNLQVPPPITYFPYRGYHGTGCNSAFRCSVFETIGLFDPRLDMGTPVPGGGDLDMFTRIILAGHTLVYDPTLVIFHDHIDDMSVLGRKLGQYNQSFIAYLTKHALIARGPARALVLDTVRAPLRRFVRGLAAVVIKRDRPLALVFAQLYYPLLGPLCLYRSHRQFTRRVARQHLGALPTRLAETREPLQNTDT
jgi:GT2 family glycosyltransferase